MCSSDLGLEANRAWEWKNLITDEVRRHNLSNIRDLFHTIIYCLSAKSARVEPFEIEQIRMLRAEGNRILVVLTHCDLNNTETAAEIMSEIICMDCALRPEDIVRVSSVSKKLLGGTQRGAFGKERALEVITSNLWDAIVERIPPNLRSFAAKRIQKWRRDSLAVIDSGIGFFNHLSNDAFKSVSGKINARARRCSTDVCRYIEEKLNEAMDYYRNFLEKHESAVLGELRTTDLKLPRFSCDGEFMSTEDKVIEIIALVLFPIGIPFNIEIKKDEMKKSLDVCKSQMERWLDEYLAEIRRSLRSTVQDPSSS